MVRYHMEFSTNSYKKQESSWTVKVKCAMSGVLISLS